LELFKTVFGEEKSPALWRWQFLRSSDGVVNVTVAEDKNRRIVGHYGGVVTRFNYQGKTIKASQAVDVMVHPKFRSLQLFLTMTRTHFQNSASHGIEFVYGYPTLAHLKAGKRFLDYRVVENVSEWIYRIRLRDRLKCRLRGSGFSGDRYHNPIIREVQRFGAEVDSLWSEIRDHYPCTTVRDQSYLNSRYADRPGKGYSMIVAADPASGRMVGLAVLGVDPWTKRRGLLLELLALPQEGKAIASLLEFAIARFSGLHTRTLVMWLPSASKHGLEKWMLAAGFRRRLRSSRSLVVASAASSIDLDDLKEKIFFTTGNSDNY
jgi:hypothetical protein